MRTTNDVKTNNRKYWLIVIALCAAILLVLSLGVYSVYREPQNATKLTPESVVEAFRKAGYDISNIQETTEHPGPMAIPKRGTRFDMQVRDGTYEILVVFYEDPKDARRSAVQINELDRRMNGEYAYAFDYGPVLVQLYPSDAKMARKLKSVLRTAE